ncbi:ATP-binding protein [bacterium]|nr:ATP-binding protein [bacterium]
MREHPDKEKYIFIEVEEGENCRLLIRDSAGGINDEYLNTIFQPYVTTRDAKNGTGLGLYMVREFIVEHMSGEIKVENISYEYDGKTLRGAQFEIIIPKSIRVHGRE